MKYKQDTHEVKQKGLKADTHEASDGEDLIPYIDYLSGIATYTDTTSARERITTLPLERRYSWQVFLPSGGHSGSSTATAFEST